MEMATDLDRPVTLVGDGEVDRIAAFVQHHLAWEDHEFAGDHRACLNGSGDGR
jgi:hypothetical protein